MSGPRLAADWLDAPGPRAVCAALEGAGRQAFYVGGCVRNAVLGRAASDIDIATDALPAQVMELARAAGIKAAPTGIAHGTVTLLPGGGAVEVTTFRRDVETFGRRAVVAFTTDIAEDAARRDFTMNALYATPGGVLVDPLGGLADLRALRVRFVGNPGARIAEDYLRILRFFRFHAWYGDPAGGLDPEGLAACAAALDGLARLSRERVGAEIAKLLSAPDPAPAVDAMAASGVLERVTPGADPRVLAPLVRSERAGGYGPSWRRRLAALGADPGWPARLRLARADARALAAVAAALASGEPARVRAYRFGIEAARDAALIGAARDAAAPPERLEAALAEGAAASFPLRGGDLPRSGPALGAALRRLEEAWIASGFTLDAEALRALDAGARP